MKARYWQNPSTGTYEIHTRPAPRFSILRHARQERQTITTQVQEEKESLGA